MSCIDVIGGAAAAGGADAGIDAMPWLEASF
jgi:hypothetical protein